MRHRTIKLGLVAATALSAALPLMMAIQPAYADYAPSSGDVVGVGSDTLQYIVDFLADGDAYGDTGYNQIGNKNKLISFDATADANARLAYGVDGGQAAQTTCTPGTGSTAGTGNSATNNTGVPCVLNPTIVLREGTQPVQRPNGSGAGFKALVQDIVAGNNTSASENVSFARASSTQSTTATLPSGENLDQLEVATDTLPMIKETTGSHAVALNATQLGDIYAANSGSCVKWNDPRIGGSSADAIIPIIPQVGSGTRSFFLAQIGLANPGTCAVVAEENDPTAIAQQTNPADAIEPISQGRLDLFQGVNNTGTSGGLPSGGYFLDPSCAYLSGTAGCGTGSVSSGTWQTTAVAPPVSVITGTATGTDGGGSAFNVTRPLYLYFRSSDLHSATPFQSPGVLNWVKTLFYNPGGATPYVSGPEGQTLLEDAGVTPLSPLVCTDITTNVTPCP